MSVRIYGSSDDLIEIDGEIREEWEISDPTSERFLVCSNGTVVSVKYSKDGCWIVKPVVDHLSLASREENKGPSSNQYSDIVTVQGHIRWVVIGVDMKRKDTK